MKWGMEYRNDVEITTIFISGEIINFTKVRALEQNGNTSTLI